MILPTVIEGWIGKEIAPDCWLITNPTFQPKTQQWTALARIGNSLCLIQLRVHISLAVVT